MSDERDRTSAGAPGREDGSPFARSAFRRGAKLASLPLGFAGRATLGLGKRLGGAPAEQVSEQLQQRAAEQLFRVLGELEGRRDEVRAGTQPVRVGPPRRHRRALSRPPVTAAGLRSPDAPLTSRVHAVLAREMGAGWRSQFVDFDPLPAAAASIGQVHRARWADGRDVAVKVQYPGADAALRSDLKQIARMSKVLAPLAGGMDINSLVAELTARVSEELDYTLEAAAQQQAAEGFAGHPEFCVPAVLAGTSRVMVSEWIEGASLATAATLPDEERNRVALQYVRFLFAGPSLVGLLHADPHPGNFKLMADGRLGVVDFGLVSRLPEGLPAAMGRILRVAQRGDAGEVATQLYTEGFVASDVDADDLLDYLSPFVEPASVPEFQFNRDWMREQFIRVRDPGASGGVALKLNLPPSYLLIHRVWLGGLAVLSQLNARAAFGRVLEEFLPATPRRSERDRRGGLSVTVEAQRCSACGRRPESAEPTGSEGVPWTWSRAQEDGQATVLCQPCARAHARGVEDQARSPLVVRSTGSHRRGRDRRPGPAPSMHGTGSSERCAAY